MILIIGNSSDKILADTISIFFCNVLLFYTLHGNYCVSSSSNGLYYSMLDKVQMERDPFNHVIRRHNFSVPRRKQNPNIIPNRFVQNINKIRDIKDVLFKQLESNEKKFYLAKAIDLLNSTPYEQNAYTTPNSNMNHPEKMFERKTNKIHELRAQIFKKLEDNEKKYYFKKMFDLMQHTTTHAYVSIYNVENN